jgi:Domain of unknown function (DUF4365)
MENRFPQRPESHQREELSMRFFRNTLPRDWTAEKPDNDYGIDLRVDIFENGSATGLELLVQLKASAEPSSADTETVQLKIATYNLLHSKLQIAMLVKYVESEKEAYWLLLKDIPPPPRDQETFTVHIPKANRLSAGPWERIKDHVRAVTDTKLAATRSNQVSVGFVGIQYVPDENDR